MAASAASAQAASDLNGRSFIFVCGARCVAARGFCRAKTGRILCGFSISPGFRVFCGCALFRSKENRFGQV